MSRATSVATGEDENDGDAIYEELGDDDLIEEEGEEHGSPLSLTQPARGTAYRPAWRHHKVGESASMGRQIRKSASREAIHKIKPWCSLPMQPSMHSITLIP